MARFGLGGLSTNGVRMEQQIRFCTSGDGTRIAYATYGQPGARPIIVVHAWSVIQAYVLELPSGGSYYDELTSDRQLIAYDRRGMGASQRDVEDVGMAAQVADLAAIADEAEFQTFDLVGALDGAAVAAVYAAQHPERVARLSLCWAFSRGEEIIRTERMRTIAALIRDDWSLGRRALSDFFNTEGSIESRLRFSAALRDSISAEIAARYVEYYSSFDIRKELTEVRCPTLIFQSPQFPAAFRTGAVSVAALIPGARLVSVEGTSDMLFARAQRQFFAEGSESPEVATLPSGTAIHTDLTVILFADIADSTELTERLGDGAFRDKARELDGALRAAIREHNGSPVEGKLLGDGVLAVFTSAREAIEAAVACGEAGSNAGLPLHLGLHAGDVIREEGNVYGGAVNIASRISGLSAAGEVLVSDIVRGLARTSAGVGFEDRGGRELKGVAEAVRVWAVREGDA